MGVGAEDFEHIGALAYSLQGGGYGGVGAVAVAVNQEDVASEFALGGSAFDFDEVDAAEGEFADDAVEVAGLVDGEGEAD